MGGCRSRRFVAHGVADGRFVHAAGNFAPAMAVALGGDCGSVCSIDRTCGVPGSDHEADAGADLCIVSGVSAWSGRRLWGIDHEECLRDPTAGEVKRLPASGVAFCEINILLDILPDLQQLARRYWLTNK